VRQANAIRRPPPAVVRGARSSWKRVEGKGRGAFHIARCTTRSSGLSRPHRLLILMVDLDTQKGEPTADEGAAVVGNLCRRTGQVGAARHGRRVGIGSRVRMVSAT